MDLERPITVTDRAVSWLVSRGVVVVFVLGMASPVIFLAMAWRAETSPVAMVQVEVGKRSEPMVVSGLAYDMTKHLWPVLAIVAANRKTLTVYGPGVNICIQQAASVDEWCQPISELQKALERYYSLP